MDEFIDKVGATSLYLARIRAAESTRPDTLFRDPYAHLFYHESTANRMESAGQPLIFVTCIRVRTRWGDDLVKRELDRGATQVITLGAGFDCRALRFARPGVTFFEVDLTEVFDFKADRLTAGGVNPAAVTVTVDYTSPTFVEVLADAGLKPWRRTVVLWEGNTYYLPAPRVPQVLKVLASGLRDPCIAFDYFAQEIIEGRSSSPEVNQCVAMLKSIGAPWQGWIANLEAMAEEIGLTVAEDRSLRALCEHYLPDLDLGPNADAEVGFGVLERASPAPAR